MPINFSKSDKDRNRSPDLSKVEDQIDLITAKLKS